jgi:elongator complex protein 2
VLPGILVTGASDGTLKIYSQNEEEDYKPIQTITILRFYPLTVSLYQNSEGSFLAIGGSSSHVRLYVSPLISPNFVFAAVLKGHEDWIRGLSFTHSNNDIILASASQDRYIRLWKISPSTTSPTTTTDTDALFLSSPFSVLTIA